MALRFPCRNSGFGCRDPYLERFRPKERIVRNPFTSENLRRMQHMGIPKVLDAVRDRTQAILQIFFLVCVALEGTSSGPTLLHNHNHGLPHKVRSLCLPYLRHLSRTVTMLAHPTRMGPKTPQQALHSLVLPSILNLPRGQLGFRMKSLHRSLFEHGLLMKSLGYLPHSST